MKKFVRFVTSKPLLLSIVMVCLFLEYLVPIFARDIDVPIIDIAGPPDPIVEIVKENVSNEGSHNEAGDLLRFTVTVTNDGNDSTWYDVTLEITLKGLELVTNYNVYLNSIEANYDVHINDTFISMKLGDIDGYDTDLQINQDVYTIIIYAIVDGDYDVATFSALANGFNAMSEEVLTTNEVIITIGDRENIFDKSQSPLVDTIYEKDSIISGTGIPESKILVLPDGTEITTVVDKDSGWSVNIPENSVLSVGDKVSVIQTELGKHDSDPTITTVKAKLLEVSQPPTVNTIFEGDTTITGDGIPGSEIIILLPDGSRISTIVKPDNKWNVTIPMAFNLIANDEIILTQIEIGKIESKPIVTIVQPLTNREVSKLQPNTPQRPTPTTPIITTPTTADTVSITLATFSFLLSLICYTLIKRKNLKKPS